MISQDQSLQARSSLWMFLKGCLLLAYMICQRAAQRCLLLSWSSLGCHQFPILRGWQRCFPVSKSRSQPPGHTVPSGMKPVPQPPPENGLCTWGKQPSHGHHTWGALGKWLFGANAHHVWGAPANICLTSMVTPHGALQANGCLRQTLPQEGHHWQMATSAKWQLCALLSLLMGLQHIGLQGTLRAASAKETNFPLTSLKQDWESYSGAAGPRERPSLACCRATMSPGHLWAHCPVCSLSTAALCTGVHLGQKGDRVPHALALHHIAR